MKKIGIFLLFIIAFIVVFLISGYISYQTFNGNGEPLVESGEAVVSNGENVNIETAVPQEKMLTIVTPGLNESEAVVRYGRENEIITQNLIALEDNSAFVDNSEEVPNGEIEVQPQINEAVNNSEQTAVIVAQNVEQPVMAQTPVNESNETQIIASEPAIREEAVQVEEREEPLVEEVQLEQAVEETPVVEEPIATEVQIELNPNIQTSDSGI